MLGIVFGGNVSIIPGVYFCTIVFGGWRWDVKTSEREVSVYLQTSDESG